jgi:hypothetical protein
LLPRSSNLCVSRVYIYRVRALSPCLSLSRSLSRSPSLPPCTFDKAVRVGHITCCLPSAGRGRVAEARAMPWRKKNKKTEMSTAWTVESGWSVERRNQHTRPGVWRALGAGALCAVAAFCLASAVHSTLHDGASSAGLMPLDLAVAAQSLAYTPERNVRRRGRARTAVIFSHDDVYDA